MASLSPHAASRDLSPFMVFCFPSAADGLSAGMWFALPGALAYSAAVAVGSV